MRRGSVVIAIGLSQLLLGGDCVDGVTPDCSDAAAQCGPSLDGGASADAADATAPPADAGAGADADLDGAADAGDE